MKKSSIQVGHSYEVQSGRNKTKVKVVSFDPEKQSWTCETAHGKTIPIKDPARFLKCLDEKKSLREIIESKGIKIIPRGRQVKSSTDDPTLTRKHHVDKKGVLVLEKESNSKTLGRMPVLAAAHRVLQEENRPMRVREIMELALGKKYCVIGGKAPIHHFSSGILKEIRLKGKDGRFKRVDKGLFVAR